MNIISLECVLTWFYLLVGVFSNVKFSTFVVCLYVTVVQNWVMFPTVLGGQFPPKFMVVLSSLHHFSGLREDLKEQVFTRSMPLFTAKTSLRTCDGPETLTSARILRNVE